MATETWKFFDHKNPDYGAVFLKRAQMLSSFQQMSKLQQRAVMAYYRDNPVDFICDWGMTTDPRVMTGPGKGVLPFILFPRQAEFVRWVYDRWQGAESGICDKSRDVGMSWLCVAIAAHISLFYDGMVTGFGSRKEEYVDKSGSPKSLFWKLRKFIMTLPIEFRGGFNDKRDSAHMRVRIPATDSVINGEAGDNIGRGDRASIYFVDESAFIERPLLVEASLSATTNCRIDVSSVNGMDNPFAEKRHSWPEEKLFTFHWTSDPRKDRVWYEKQCQELAPSVVAQEIDLDYSASKEGILIPAPWVHAALDLHKHIDMDIGGERSASFDVADRGADLNALLIKQGVLLYYGKAWSGKKSTIFDSVLKVMNVCDMANASYCIYDSDGVGAGVRGDAQELNDQRVPKGMREIKFRAFHGGASVINPDDPVIMTARSSGLSDRTNKDFFENLKAQAWWHLRLRFEHCYRARNGEPYDPSMLLSIQTDAMGATLTRLITELSQPTFSQNKKGKVVIDKYGDGRSPNLADGVMMLYAPTEMRYGFF